MLIEPQLNRVFLKLLLGRPCRLDDVKCLDPPVHRSLLLLKRYPGDASDMSLTFSVTRSEFNCQEEVDLVPNGRNIPVTKSAGANAAAAADLLLLVLLLWLPLLLLLVLTLRVVVMLLGMRHRGAGKANGAGQEDIKLVILCIDAMLFC